MGEKQPLVKGGHQPQICAYLLPKARGTETVGAAVHAFPGAADVAADGGQAAPGFLMRLPTIMSAPRSEGLLHLHKFAVAVVHHAEHAGLALLAEGDQLPNLLHGEGGPRSVPLGALDGDELGFIRNGPADALIVKGAVRQQLHLPVAHAVFRQGAGGGTDTDDLLQCVVGPAHRA